ncbi:MAG: hypothetical protein AB7S36_08145 [Planctomycetota bacterium]
MLLAASLVVLAGCYQVPDIGSEEELGLKAHKNLPELMRILVYTADLLVERFDSERYHDAHTFAVNMITYAEQLKWYEPANRPYAGVQKYDTYSTSLAARAEVAEHYAHMRKRIQGTQEATAIKEYVQVLTNFLLPASGLDGGFYEERLAPSPLEEPNPRESVPDPFSRRVNPQ